MRHRGLPPAHRATTVELRTLYPFVVPDDLGVDGCYIGREASGGLFCFDPWECYAKGKLTSPNIVVFGQIGRGKSAFVKSFLWRQLCFGRQCWVLDPKGEYGGLARACGVTPLRLGPGLGLRLNPLDVGPLDVGPLDVGAGRAPELAPAHQRRSELLGALLSSSLGRSLQPEERAAADVSLRAVEQRMAVPTLAAVAEALLAPEPAHAAALGTDTEGLRRDGRQVALELRRLVVGDLAGMFDGETSPGLDMAAGMVVLDLSRLYASPALGLLMVCALSWLQGALAGGEGTKRLVVLDEAWAVLSHLATARWLQATFKLSRSFGVANIAVVHRLSDLSAAGFEGSEQQRLAEGLLADAETRVLFAQAPAEAERAGELLGLTGTEQVLLSQLPRGVALWRVGQSSFLVEHQLGEEELALADTDAAMRAVPVPAVVSGA
ncbi:MAG: ATP-binding protein [Acidimicrobiales bacterium]